MGLALRHGALVVVLALPSLAVGVGGCGPAPERGSSLGEPPAERPPYHPLWHPGGGFEPDRASHADRLGRAGVVDVVAAPAIDRQIAGGEAHTCVRRPGDVTCWGWNRYGQLGDDTTTDRLSPTPVVGLNDAVGIVAGADFTCARRVANDVACWGSNVVGQLGDGSKLAQARPTEVKGLSDAVEVVAGSNHACARRARGSVVCWGANRCGQIGDTTLHDRATPTPVAQLANAVELAAGKAHTCARLADGNVACWGNNFYGQVGDALVPNHHVVPFVVPGLDDAVEIATGHHHTCARRSSGDVVCWGQNLVGQLGDGSLVDHAAPRAVVGIHDAAQITAGGYHTCVRRSSGSLVCWGYNEFGQLGDGSFDSRALPAPVADLTDAVDLVAGRFGHTCARRAPGTLTCWGRNLAGEIGDGSKNEQPLPVSVVGLP